MKYLSQIIAIMFVLILIFANIPTTANQNIKDQHSETSYDLLIISPEIFSKHLAPLVDHKNSHDVKTKLVTVEEIYNQMFWQGKDNAEKIKYFIKEAHETWDIKYVLLVGGRKDQSKIGTYWVPARYSHIFRYYEGHEHLSEQKILTDLYFADIYDFNGNFSSWDDDNDGIFGEWSLDSVAEDIPDLYPDVSVGRLPCRNVIDVKIIVNKIINYETANFEDYWFKKMVVVGGDTYPYKTDYVDGENYTQQAIDIMTDFESVKIWSTLGNLHWTTMVRELNKGCGFIFFSGHGSAASWVTIPPDDPTIWVGEFRLSHMKYLKNKNMLPICLTGSGCFNNMFNVSISYAFVNYWNFSLVNSIFKPLFSCIPGLEKGIILPYGVPRCWGWNLVRNPRGGSIATIGATGYSYESCDIDGKRGGCEWLDIHFFEEYNQSSTKILGDCWSNTITRFLQNFSINWSDDSQYGDANIAKNVEQWLLIGDPSLKIGGYN